MQHFNVYSCIFIYWLQRQQNRMVDASPWWRSRSLLLVTVTASFTDSPAADGTKYRNNFHVNVERSGFYLRRLVTRCSITRGVTGVTLTTRHLFDLRGRVHRVWINHIVQLNPAFCHHFFTWTIRITWGRSASCPHSLTFTWRGRTSYFQPEHTFVSEFRVFVSDKKWMFGSLNEP